MSGMLIFTSAALVFVAATQGMPLDRLALVARAGACTPASCGAVAIGGMVLGRLPYPGH